MRADERTIAATYEYTDADGEVPYRVVRYEPKDFRPQHLGPDGEWINGYGSDKRVLYRLPEVIESPIVFVVEGERDAETLCDNGFKATTNAGGANGWRDEFNAVFAGKDVIVVPDNDKPGRQWAVRVATGIRPYASQARILLLDDAKDISEWFALGHSEVELANLLESNKLIDVRTANEGELRAALIGQPADLASAPGETGASWRIRDLPPILEDLAEEQDIDWVVEGMVARSALTMIAGPPGSGKSSEATAMGFAVANGEPFAGLTTAKSDVLYLDRENTKPVVADRVRRLQGNGARNFHYLGRWSRQQPPPIDSPVLLEYVIESNPKPFIIIDSLVAFHPGNENDAVETRRFMNLLRALADHGAAVLIIHHPGKGEGARAYRGSSDIEGAVDVLYTVTNNGGRYLGRISLAVFKSRFLTGGPFHFRYDDGLFVPASAFASLANRGRLTELLAKNPGMTLAGFDEITKTEGIPRKQARNYLKQGTIDGEIIAIRQLRRGYRYYLKGSQAQTEVPHAA